MTRSRYLLPALAIMLAAMEASLGSQTPASSPSSATATSEAAPNAPSSSEPRIAEAPRDAVDTDLQAQVQDALMKVPALSNDSLRVVAAGDSLELSGTVATGKERLAAVRLAQSYARGRKVVDHIVVSGRSGPLPEAGTPDKPKASHQANSQP
jgi:osmotically-inducible protein OsmY